MESTKKYLAILAYVHVVTNQDFFVNFPNLIAQKVAENAAALGMKDTDFMKLAAKIPYSPSWLENINRELEEMLNSKATA